MKLKFEELLKKMVEKKVIDIYEPNNIISIDKIKKYADFSKIPKSYNIFLENAGSGDIPPYEFYGTNSSKKNSIIKHYTELEKKSYKDLNILPPPFRYIVLLNDNGIMYYMNLDKCNKETAECEIQAWDSGYSPEEQPEEISNEKYQSFEEFFRAMNEELVEIIENGKEIPEDYIIKTIEEI